MSEYGITERGVNIKRLDTIMDEVHTGLSDGWGVNTRLNPKSKLNVLVTNFSDKIAELWELGKGAPFPKKRTVKTEKKRNEIV